MWKTSEKDAEVWEILIDVPKVNGLWPYILLILNLFIPGVGTMIAACLGDPNAWSKTQLIIGVFQMLLSVYIIGWFWAVYWGYLMIIKSRKELNDMTTFLDKTKPTSEA